MRRDSPAAEHSSSNDQQQQQQQQQRTAQSRKPKGLEGVAGGGRGEAPGVGNVPDAPPPPTPPIYIPPHGVYLTHPVF